MADPLLSSVVSFSSRKNGLWFIKSRLKILEMTVGQVWAQACLVLTLVKFVPIGPEGKNSQLWGVGGLPKLLSSSSVKADYLQIWPFVCVLEFVKP